MAPRFGQVEGTLSKASRSFADDEIGLRGNVRAARQGALPVQRSLELVEEPQFDE